MNYLHDLTRIRPEGRTFAVATIADGGGTAIRIIDDATGAALDEHETDDAVAAIAYTKAAVASPRCETLVSMPTQR